MRLFVSIILYICLANLCSHTKKEGSSDGEKELDLHRSVHDAPVKHLRNKRGLMKTAYTVTGREHRVVAHLFKALLSCSTGKERKYRSHDSKPMQRHAASGYILLGGWGQEVRETLSKHPLYPHLRES